MYYSPSIWFVYMWPTKVQELKSKNGGVAQSVRASEWLFRGSYSMVGSSSLPTSTTFYKEGGMIMVR